jgi:hypothetical protein
LIIIPLNYLLFYLRKSMGRHVNLEDACPKVKKARDETALVAEVKVCFVLEPYRGGFSVYILINFQIITLNIIRKNNCDYIKSEAALFLFHRRVFFHFFTFDPFEALKYFMITLENL